MSYDIGMTAVAMLRAMINAENGNAGLTAEDYSIAEPSVIDVDGRNTSIVLTGAGTYSGTVTVNYNRLALQSVFDLDSSDLDANLTFVGEDLEVNSLLEAINGRFGTVLGLEDIDTVTGIDATDWGDLMTGSSAEITVTPKASNVAWVGAAVLMVAKPKTDLGEAVTNGDMTGLDLNLPDAG